MKQHGQRVRGKKEKAHSNNYTKFSVLDLEIQNKLETVELKVQETGGSKIMRALIDHVKKFTFNPKTNGEPLTRLYE